MLHPLNAAEAGRGAPTRIPRTLAYLRRTDGGSHVRDGECWVGGRVRRRRHTVHILRRGSFVTCSPARSVYGPRAIAMAGLALIK